MTVFAKPTATLRTITCPATGSTTTVDLTANATFPGGAGAPPMTVALSTGNTVTASGLVATYKRGVASRHPRNDTVHLHGQGLIRQHGDGRASKC